MTSEPPPFVDQGQERGESEPWWESDWEWWDGFGSPKSEGRRRMSEDPTDVLLRPQVLACQERAEALRVEADAVFDTAEFWASLDSDCCTDDDDAEGCENPTCYRAWRTYPDG